MVLQYEITVQVHCSSRVGLQSPCSRPAVGCLAAEGGKFGLGEGPQSISLCLTVCPSDWYLHEKGCCAFPPWSVLTPSSPLCGKLIPTHVLSQTVNARSGYVLDFFQPTRSCSSGETHFAGEFAICSCPAAAIPHHDCAQPTVFAGKGTQVNIHCICTEYTLCLH